MSSALLHPGALRGTGCVPPSKSAAHRALLCAALAQGESLLSPIDTSEDMAATLGCIAALGCTFVREDAALRLQGIQSPPQSAALACGESGSTLRFLIPIAGALGVQARFTGKGRLPQRPLGCYARCLPPRGLSLQSEGGLPLTVQGRLQAGLYELPGDVSSQFVTGLLLALPLLQGDSEIRLTSPLQSAAYVEMTRRVQAGFGVQSQVVPSGWHVPGGQCYRPGRWQVERDWSQAAFFLAAGALGGDISLPGLDAASAQGDRAIEALLRGFGANLHWQNGALCAGPGPLHGQVVDAGQVPDLVPILAVVGALAAGETRIVNAARLRLKESDRLDAMAALINALGGHAEQLPDGLVLHGVQAFAGGTVDGRNDHRVVMAAAIAALRAQAPVCVTHAQAVRKSWPSFFADYAALGGQVELS